MNLITLEEYKAVIGITNDKDDVKIAFLINSISGLIQAYLGFDLEGGRDYTQTFSLDYDTDTLFLDHYPVEAVSSITEVDRYTYDSTVHVPLSYAADYSINEAEGIITRIARPGGFASWAIGPGTITVSYQTAPKWGFGLDVIPADLKLAAIELITYYKDKEFRQSKSVQGTTLVNTLAEGTDFPRHIQVILDRYK